MTGIANLLQAPLGSPPGYAYVSMTTFNYRLGDGGRTAGYVNALALAACVVVAGTMLAWAPPFIFAGLVVSLGIDFLWSWIVEARRRVTRAEWAVIIAITATAALLDLLSAIALGLAVSVGLFVWEYARTPVVRYGTTLVDARSTHERRTEEDELLSVHGDRVQIVLLQGFLFFGSAERVLTEVAARLERCPEPARLILDLRHVTGLDTASVAVMRRIVSLAAHRGTKVTFTRGNAKVASAVRRADADGVGPVDHELDDALIEAEHELIAWARPATTKKAPSKDLGSKVAEIFLEEGTLVRFDRGTTLVRAEEKTDHVLILRSGMVEVRAPGVAGARLRVLGPGSAIGEIAPYLRTPRSADVVALDDVEAFHIDLATLERLDSKDPARAVHLHRFLARALSEKVNAANRLVRRSSL